jgi:hypothetical protein
MENKIIIRKFAYLKTPIYKWDRVNNQGGSFSNSGEHRSWQKCVNEASAVAGNDLPIETYDVDGEGNETLNEYFSSVKGTI